MARPYGTPYTIPYGIAIAIVMFAILVYANSSGSISTGFTGLASSAAANGQPEVQPTSQPASQNADWPRYSAIVQRVVDGDTVILSTGESVRLIGVDTPEKGQEGYLGAKQFLASLVEGKTVSLEADVEDKDKYARLLRYIYFGDTFVNLEILRQGYARALSIEPDTRYTQLFAEAEALAKDSRLGVWASGEFQCLGIFSFHYNAKLDDNLYLEDEYVTFRNSCTDQLSLAGWRLEDSQGNEYSFSQTIPAKGQLTLRTGPGKDTTEDIYWSQPKAVWGNSGDTLTVWDSAGKKVLEYAYPE